MYYDCRSFVHKLSWVWWVCLCYLYVNFVQEFCFQSQWIIYMKLEVVDSIFIWWTMDSEGLSFPFSNKSFYRLTLKAHFFRAPCWVQQICTVYISVCVQESHVCKTNFHIGIWRTWKYRKHKEVIGSLTSSRKVV
jgi:hypothetical protein